MAPAAGGQAEAAIFSPTTPRRPAAADGGCPPAGPARAAVTAAPGLARREAAGEWGGQSGAGRGEREPSRRGRGPAPCAAPAPCARPPPAAASLPDLCSSSEKGENVCVWRGGGRALSSRGAPGNRAGWASGGGGGGGGGGERAASGCPVCARAEWARAGRGRPEPSQAAARSGRAGCAEPSAVARCGATSVDELRPLGAQPRAASATAPRGPRALREGGV